VFDLFLEHFYRPSKYVLKIDHIFVLKIDQTLIFNTIIEYVVISLDIKLERIWSLYECFIVIYVKIKKFFFYYMSFRYLIVKHSYSDQILSNFISSLITTYPIIVLKISV